MAEVDALSAQGLRPARARRRHRHPGRQVTGSAGGGGGTGEGPDGKGTGSGSGTGFGLSARGIGVYEVRDGKVEWKPAIDVTSLAKGGQMLGALVIMCLTLVVVRRRRDN